MKIYPKYNMKNNYFFYYFLHSLNVVLVAKSVRFSTLALDIDDRCFNKSMSVKLTVSAVLFLVCSSTFSRKFQSKRKKDILS